MHAYWRPPATATYVYLTSTHSLQFQHTHTHTGGGADGRVLQRGDRFAHGRWRGIERWDRLGHRHQDGCVGIGYMEDYAYGTIRGSVTHHHNLSYPMAPAGVSQTGNVAINGIAFLGQAVFCGSGTVVRFCGVWWEQMESFRVSFASPSHCLSSSHHQVHSEVVWSRVAALTAVWGGSGGSLYLGTGIGT